MKSLTTSTLSLRRFGFLAIIATLLTLFFATKDSFHQLALGLRITWGKNLWWKAMEWYAWGILSPILFRICRRFDFSSEPWRTVLAHLAGGVVVSLVHCCILTTGARIEAQVLHTGMTWPYLFRFILTNHFHEDMLTYSAIVSAWYALEFHNRFRERERRAAQLEAQVAQARLQALETQLQPHFLFNTLNGIAALIYENPKAAHSMLAKLSELLRMSLKGDGEPEVLLRSELDFGRRYLELEQMRFGSRLAIEWDIDPEALDARIPNLLLQPLLENAVKHGIAPVSQPGQITVSARRDKDRLRMRVADNGPGLAETKGLNGDSGIGLQNTRDRLRALYGNEYQIEFSSTKGEGFTVEIAIPFRTAVNPSSIHSVHENPHLNRR
jgi:hypothetical protein